MADYGRISGSMAEVAATVPSGDAVGRISGSMAEVVATVPSGDAAGRLSGSMAEVAVTEVGDEVRVTFVLVEVFSQSPDAQPHRNPLGGGVQGAKIRSV